MADIAPPVLTVICVIALLAGLWFLLGSIKPCLAEHSWARQALAGSEVVLAVSVTIIATMHDVFKGDSWKPDGARPVVAAGGVAFLIGAYALVKIVTQWIKDNDATSLKDLREENKLLTGQRDVLRRVLTLADQILDKKLLRIRDSQKERGPNFQGLLDSLEPPRQVQVILTALHHFCARLLDPGRKLRLGVYLQVDGHLKPIYSFDGERESCFSDSSWTSMKINDPEGPQSEITRLFHSQDKIRIIPDCHEAVKTGNFHYFKRDQEKYLCSMAVVKHVIRNLKGERDVMILALDTDQPNFFQHSNKSDIELCCETLMKRLEFELLWLEVQSTSTPTPP